MHAVWCLYVPYDSRHNIQREVLCQVCSIHTLGRFSGLKDCETRLKTNRVLFEILANTKRDCIERWRGGSYPCLLSCFCHQALSCCNITAVEKFINVCSPFIYHDCDCLKSNKLIKFNIVWRFLFIFNLFYPISSLSLALKARELFYVCFSVFFLIAALCCITLW